MKNKRAKELQKEHKDVDSDLKNCISNNLKSKKDTRKLKEKIALLRHGKSLIEYQDKEANDRMALISK